MQLRTRQRCRRTREEWGAQCDPENSKDSKLQTGTEHAKKLQPVGAMKKEKDAPGRQRKTMDNVMKSTHTCTHTHSRGGRADKTRRCSSRGAQQEEVNYNKAERKQRMRCAALLWPQGYGREGRERGETRGRDRNYGK